MNDRLRILQRQPRRISITLSYHVHEALLSRSEEEGRSVSNLCAFLLEEARRAPDRPSCNSRLLTATVRSHGNFIRSFTLPNNVDSQHLKAHFHDGLLEVAIPKTPETQSSSITVPVD